MNALVYYLSQWTKARFYKSNEEVILSGVSMIYLFLVKEELCRYCLNFYAYFVYVDFSILKGN